MSINCNENCSHQKEGNCNLSEETLEPTAYPFKYHKLSNCPYFNEI